MVTWPCCFWTGDKTDHGGKGRHGGAKLLTS
jgi:hypothetical protein